MAETANSNPRRAPRDPATIADEPVNPGRREAHVAGGNGEQLSRERARTTSEDHPDEGPKPFRKPIDPPRPPESPKPTPGIDPARKGEPAIRASRSGGSR